VEDLGTADRLTLLNVRFSRTLSVMEVLLSPVLEAKLARSPARQGRNPGELVQQVVAL
jgi:hypothetical protein